MQIKIRMTAIILGLIVTGCVPGKEGTAAAAKGFLQSEINLWLAGQPSQAESFRAKLMSHKPPTAFEVQSVIPQEPDMFAFNHDLTQEIPANYREFSTYLVNVKYEFRSQADTPITKIMAYRLTWNVNEKAWHMREQ
jgi:hypothetical protein